MKNSRSKQVEHPIAEATFDNLSTGCQLIGFDWRYLYVNNAAIQQGKCEKKEDMLGYSVQEKYPGIEETEVFRALERCMKSGSSEIIVDELEYSDKTTGWFEFRIEKVPNGILILSTDITRRKNAEDNFKIVVECAPCAMILSNENGEITLVNAEAEKLFGYSRDELVGSSIEILLPYKFRQKHPGHRSNFFSSPTKRAMGAGRELYATKKDGTEFPVEVGLNPIDTKSGVIVLASVIDITQQVQIKRERLNKQHEILNATIEAQERERSEIGRELHDNVNQLLASIKMMLGIANSKPELQDKIITKCFGLTDECIQEIRRLTSSLVPDIDEDIDLIRSIDDIIKRLELSDKITFDTDISVELVSQLSQKQLLTIYRIIQEQISNIIRHSRANHVMISLSEVNHHAVLVVTDNGIGFKHGRDRNGIGIRNMNSRCKALNGTFSITSSKGSGCTVRASIPKDYLEKRNKDRVGSSFYNG